MISACEKNQKIKPIIDTLKCKQMHPVELLSPIHTKPQPNLTGLLRACLTYTHLLHIPIHIHILMYKTKEIRAVNKINNTLKRTKLNNFMFARKTLGVESNLNK